MPSEIILLLTHSEDFYTIDLVEDALTNLGATPIRVNTDQYPEQMPLDINFNNETFKVNWNIKGKIISSDEVKGVWYRRIWSPTITESMDPEYRKICIRESKSIFKFTFPLLENAVWMDPYPIVEFASNKLLQLKLAIDAGLSIPNTLVTNNEISASRFFHEQERVITKLAMPTTHTMGHTAMAMKTHQVQAEDIEQMDSLKHCPMTFQEEIIKDIELRVVYVDGSFFTGAIDASKSQNGQTDWRLSSVNEVSWQQFELPWDVKLKISKLMQKLNLTFGAIDLIKTRDGQYVFLEVNPVGEWGMLQKELNYPIAEAISNSIYNRMKQKI